MMNPQIFTIVRLCKNFTIKACAIEEEGSVLNVREF